MKIVIEVEGKRLEVDRSELLGRSGETVTLSAKAAVMLMRALPDNGYGNVVFTILVDGVRLEGCRILSGYAFGDLTVNYQRERRA